VVRRIVDGPYTPGATENAFHLAKALDERLAPAGGAE
jgi:hypothetical protein